MPTHILIHTLSHMHVGGNTIVDRRLKQPKMNKKKTTTEMTRSLVFYFLSHSLKLMNTNIMMVILWLTRKLEISLPEKNGKSLRKKKQIYNFLKFGYPFQMCHHRQQHHKKKVRLVNSTRQTKICEHIFHFI